MDDTALLSASVLSLGPKPPSFVGPEPPISHAEVQSDPAALLGAFASAQRQNSGRILMHAAWTDQKIERKEVWREMGVPDYLIVPTLYAGELHWDGTTVEAPEFVHDGEGGFALNMEDARPIMTPADPNCRIALRNVLLQHRQVVLKPAIGANSRGVLLLNIDASLQTKTEADLTQGDSAATSFGLPSAVELEGASMVPASSTESADACVSPSTQSTECLDATAVYSAEDDTPYVWLGSPIKTWRSSGSAQDRPLPFSQLWHEHIIGNQLLRGAFLAEPSIAHDQEVCVLAINGGRLLLLAGRSLVMERLVRIRGYRHRAAESPAVYSASGSSSTNQATRETDAFVAETDFETPDWLTGSSIRNWKRADVETRQRHTTYALTQIVEEDPHGRTISDVLLDTAELLAKQYFGGQEAAALRVDFFVRWGNAAAGTGARVWVNEVENGFNPSALVGWYGSRLTLLALRFWLKGGGDLRPDEANRTNKEAAVTI